MKDINNTPVSLVDSKELQRAYARQELLFKKSGLTEADYAVCREQILDFQSEPLLMRRLSIIVKKDMSRRKQTASFVSQSLLDRVIDERYSDLIKRTHVLLGRPTSRTASVELFKEKMGIALSEEMVSFVQKTPWYSQTEVMYELCLNSEPLFYRGKLGTWAYFIPS